MTQIAKLNNCTLYRGERSCAMCVSHRLPLKSLLSFSLCSVGWRWGVRVVPLSQLSLSAQRSGPNTPPPLPPPLHPLTPLTSRSVDWTDISWLLIIIVKQCVSVSASKQVSKHFVYLHSFQFPIDKCHVDSKKCIKHWILTDVCSKSCPEL